MSHAALRINSYLLVTILLVIATMAPASAKDRQPSDEEIQARVLPILNARAGSAAAATYQGIPVPTAAELIEIFKECDIKLDDPSGRVHILPKGLFRGDLQTWIYFDGGDGYLMLSGEVRGDVQPLGDHFYVQCGEGILPFSGDLRFTAYVYSEGDYATFKGPLEEVVTTLASTVDEPQPAGTVEKLWGMLQCEELIVWISGIRGYIKDPAEKDDPERISNILRIWAYYMNGGPAPG